MTVRTITHKTAKSKLSYTLGADHVLSHSTTLGRTFKVATNSNRGRYLLSLIARKTKRKGVTLNYATQKNSYTYRVGSDVMTRWNRVTDQIYTADVNTAWARSVVGNALAKGTILS